MIDCRKRVKKLPQIEPHGFIVPGYNLKLSENVAMTLRFLSGDDAYMPGPLDVFEADNGAIFLAADRPGLARVLWVGNYVDEMVSHQAAGIIATIFTLTGLSEVVPEQAKGAIRAKLDQLKNYATTHVESAIIERVLD
ncbi:MULTISPECIES: antirestriction protein [Aeromonas]|uniref:antirestriction protein n=1 Tax=Aeromonas TaxID=642 RepID=UPI00224DEB22|nr:antirestriction protein [Aeromonas hydrophila]MCX4117316.1 antirestriction protein [Aeromonas hydrophila]